MSNVDEKKNEADPASLAVDEESRALASVQLIGDFAPIDGADLICRARVLGYELIVKKDEFPTWQAPPDPNHPILCVFFEIDSVFEPEFAAVVSPNLKGNRIKTVKLRGVVSQGIAKPLSIVQFYGLDPTTLQFGQNLTKELKILKYVASEEQEQYAKVSANGNDKLVPFPSYIPKTDATRLQSNPYLWQMMVEQDRQVVVTRKEDGCSATFVYPDKICGRNYEIVVQDPELASKDKRHYLFVEKKFNILGQLQQLGLQIAIQGEIVGPGINANRLNLKEFDFRVFKVYEFQRTSDDPTMGKIWPHQRVQQLCQDLGLHTVPELIAPISARVLAEKFKEGVRSWVDYVNTIYYYPKKVAEGVVVKTCDDDEDKRPASFKVISPLYLLEMKQ